MFYTRTADRRDQTCRLNAPDGYPYDSIHSPPVNTGFSARYPGERGRIFETDDMPCAMPVRNHFRDVGDRENIRGYL